MNLYKIINNLECEYYIAASNLEKAIEVYKESFKFNIISIELIDINVIIGE